MEIREWATRILSATTLEEKLLNPGILTDENPGPSLIWKSPSRPTGMHFQKRTKEEKLPSFQELAHEENRAVSLHRFAGHELLAVEIMAYTLLAFPDSPSTFRRGVAHTLKEEQGHVKLYIDEMNRMGMQFGDLPLYKHFWIHTPYITSPLKFVSIMNLTFEMANLDFAPMYRDWFLFHGDDSSAKLMEQIIRDEISHVSFGHKWLKRFKPAHQEDFQTWISNLTPFLTKKRARGKIFFPEYRRKAGISEEWIAQLAP